MARQSLNFGLFDNDPAADSAREGAEKIESNFAELYADTASLTGSVASLQAEVAGIDADVSGKQPLDTDLTAIAALVSAADRVPYATGPGAWALAVLTSAARTLLAAASAADQRTALGISASNTPFTPAGSIAATTVQAALAEIDGDIATKAPLNSPALVGTPTAPTAAPGTNTTQIATMAAIQQAIANLLDSAPGALDTLNELAAALGDDPNFATTVTNALAGKQPLDATLTGLAALAMTAGQMAYATGNDTFATVASQAFGRSLLTLADAATGRTALGISATNTPFTPAGGIAASNVQSALAELDSEKANLASPTFTGTVSGVTKAMVGLGNVDNTADTAKPVSTAQQTALNLKANIADPTFTTKLTVPYPVFNESAARGYDIRTRSVITTFPVPTFRPTTVTTVMAVDIMPNGSPAENFDNGTAWLDVCYQDVRDNNNPVNATRIGATSTAHVIGGVEYNGATARNVEIRVGGSNKWGYAASGGAFYPTADNAYQIGYSSLRPTVIYAVSGTINTSDEREKQDIEPIPDAVLDAWAEVNFIQYRWRSAVAEKGEAARQHAGVIAQQIDRAFRARGLDATRYGLLCYDEWPDDWVDLPAQVRETGKKKRGKPVVETIPPRRVLRRAAGNRWGIRGEECLMMEVALQRRTNRGLQEAIAALGRRLDALEAA